MVLEKRYKVTNPDLMEDFYFNELYEANYYACFIGAFVLDTKTKKVVRDYRECPNWAYTLK